MAEALPSRHCDKITLGDENWNFLLKKHGTSEIPLWSASKNRCFLLSLEADKPNPSWKPWEKALDMIVQAFQPSPVMTHSELMFSPTQISDNDKGPHFATYYNKTSDWGATFGDGYSFYLGANAPSWRATPVMAANASARVEESCDRHVDAPYSIARYFFSAPPGRMFSCLLPNAPKSPAHCATITARILKRALPELNMKNYSAWYGPSTLFLELSSVDRMKQYHREWGASIESMTGASKTEAEGWISTLLRGSNDDVLRLKSHECETAVDLLSSRSISISATGDAADARHAEKRLALALLRWSEIQYRNAPSELDVLCQGGGLRRGSR